MYNSELEKEIEIQKAKVKNGQPRLKLVKPCKIGNGILQFNQVEQNDLISKFDSNNLSVCFFIPASGSGSRMFQFLFEFLENPDSNSSSNIERFLSNFENFAFYRSLPKKIKSIATSNEDNLLERIIKYLLNDHGLGLSNLPKGLVPFHKNGPFILNAFQEQVLQANNIKNDNLHIHFTINAKFEDKIKKSIKTLEELTGNTFDISFSIQNEKTDAFVFDEKIEVVLDGEKFLKRPAGHGALLENLNNIKDDLIFIRNIDNIQNYKQSKKSEEIIKFLGGLTIFFQEELLKIQQNPSVEKLVELNQKFEFLSETEIENLNNDGLLNIINRPIRVCGMVKNEGQPGGGPFWIEDSSGKITKQIIEKSQINNTSDQLKILIQSTHFNPVMICTTTKDLSGNKFNLFDFKDDSKYFIVDKTQKATKVKYIELPGLWNGSMSNWNTIFVEIPSETFSPVKTVLDLLESAHLED